MKIRKFIIAFLAIAGSALPVFSQSHLSVVEGAAMNMTPLQLVQTQLIGTGLTISNATYNGSAALISSSQIGTFTDDSSAFAQLQLAAGIVMTSGKASYAVGPNNTSGKSFIAGGPGDPDLNIIAGVGTHDKCVLEFDFVPQSDTIKFRYVFGSEEFYEFCNQFNDAFGFFLSGPGINGTFSNFSVDIALMPASASYVTINNLCANPSSNWCNCPHNPSYGNYINCLEAVGNKTDFQYDGMTWVYTAWHVVVPCSTYHIKLAIADAGDGALDSGVFLEKNSFSSTGLSISTSYQMPQLGLKAIEGCSDALVTFKLASPTTLVDTIHFTIGGTAINGTDYTTIPPYAIIPAGQDSTSLPIHAFMDNIPEGIETVILNIPIPSCVGAYTYHDTIFIYDNTTLNLSLGNDTTGCFGSLMVLNAAAAGGQSPYQYVWNNGGTSYSITVAPPAGISYFNAGVWDQCNNFSYDTIMVTTLALPIVTNTTADFTICSGGTTDIPLQSSTPGATFTYTAFCSSGTTTGYSNGSFNVIQQPLSNNGIAPDTVFYTVYAHIANCTGQAKVFSVIVYPKPNVSFMPPGQTICSGQLAQINLFSSTTGVTFSWTHTSPPTIIGAIPGTGNQIVQILANTGITVDTVTYHVTALVNGCPGNIYDVKVVVNPVAVVTTTPNNDSVCSKNSTAIILTSSSSPVLFSWTASLISGSVTGYTDGAGNTIVQPLTNNGFIPGIVQYHITPTINGCTGQPYDFTVKVNPVPGITNGVTSFQQCSGILTNISLQSGVSGTGFSWTATASSPTITGWGPGNAPAIAQTLSNSGTSADSVTYHVTPDYHGCAGQSKDFSVTVFPVPDTRVTPPINLICSGTSGIIHMQSNVRGTLFNWTATNTSGNVTGFSNSVIPDTLINQVLNNSGNTIDSVIYHITPVASGCNGATVNYPVHVNPVANVIFLASQTICSGGTSVVVPISSSATGGTLVFTRTVTCDPAVTPCPANGSGTLIPSATLSNSLVIPADVVYTIAATFNGCPGLTSTHTITVDPMPVVTNSPMDQTTCSGLTSTLVNLTASVAGTTFTWTATATPGITGYTPAGTNTIPAQILNNATSSAGTVTYHIIPTSTIGMTCQGTPSDYLIHVNPLPVPSVTGSSTVCAQQQNVAYSTPATAGNTYSWIITNGIITSGANTSSVVVTWGNSGTGSLKVIETVGLTSCSDSAFYNVTINPRPVPAVNGPATACELTTQVYSTPLIAGHTYSWSVTGGTIQSGQGTNQIQVNWGSPGAATVDVTETILATGCSAPANSYSVTLTSLPLAAGIITGPAQVCEASNNNVYSVPAIAWATSYTWTYSGSGATITNNGNSVSINFDAGATGGTLTVTGMNSCGTGPSSGYLINVHPKPVMSFTSCNDPVTTTAAQPFKLNGGIPLGGTYSGAGIASGILNPGLAGPGNHMITYSYTNTWSCSNNATLPISILAAAPFNCGTDYTDPRDNSMYPTVYIGLQCWLASNLNYGTNIPSSSVQRDNCAIEKYCLSDIAANCALSGGLYQWDELMQYTDVSGIQGLCPPAWHVPSEAEWIMLINNWGGNGFAGSPLKYNGFSGFDALLNGGRYDNASWRFPGFATMIWTSTSHGPLKAWAHGMNDKVPSVSWYPANRADAFQVRCIKD